jgi:hypothetical protein
LPRAGCDNSPEYVSHHQLAYELTANPLFDPQYGGLDALVEELERSDAPIACISSENLSLLWHNSVGLARLRDTIMLAGFTPKIVCYLRPQASFCTSVYAQIVCNGGYRSPFLEYLNDTLTQGRFLWNSRVGTPFDYERLLDPFAAVFGRDSIIVRRYRSTAPDKALLFEFGRLLLASEDFAEFAIPQLRENGSLDFNTVLSCLGNRQTTSVRIRFAPLRVRQVLRFGLRFRRANAAIANRYAIRLPAFELLDIGLASPFRRTLAKTRALALARRALTRTSTMNALDSRVAPASPRRPQAAPIFAPHRARPALLEVLIAMTAAVAGWASLVYGTRIASTALVEFGMLSIIVSGSAVALLAQHAVESRGIPAAYQFIHEWRARLSVAGYALVGLYALVNAWLDVGLARYETDSISYPGTVAAAAAALAITAAQPLRERLLGEISGSQILAKMRDDRVYLACCYVALFGQVAHAALTDWWLDTAIDVLVVVLVVSRLSQMWRSSDVNKPRVAG